VIQVLDDSTDPFVKVQVLSSYPLPLPAFSIMTFSLRCSGKLRNAAFSWILESYKPSPKIFQYEVEFPEVSGDDSWNCEVETKVPGDCYSVNLDPGSVFHICPVLQYRNFDQSFCGKTLQVN
jgi:hypothetical protein